MTQGLNDSKTPSGTSARVKRHLLPTFSVQGTERHGEGREKVGRRQGGSLRPGELFFLDQRDDPEEDDGADDVVMICPTRVPPQWMPSQPRTLPPMKPPTIPTLDRHIFADRVPQPKELHIVVFDETDEAQVVQLLPAEPQRAQTVDLRLDLVRHFARERDVFVAAFEIVLSAQVGVLVENDLIHVEFVQVGIEQRQDDRVKTHIYSLPFVGLCGSNAGMSCSLNRLA